MLSKLLRVIVIASMLSGLVAEASFAQPPASFAPIVEPLMPAVVNIYTTRHTQTNGYRPIPPGSAFEYFNELFEKFDNPYYGYDELYSNPGAVALGSGFIIDADGYIVTNHHVVENADIIKIKLHDNTELDAKLIGSDEITDLALLKVNTKKKLTAVSFGDSNKTRIGDWIITIGNPFGLGGTVTVGIISSKGRDLVAASGMIDDYLQTDAAINQGNSGGPMFNMDGEVIGINNILISPSGTNVGIGFAIPSSTAQGIISKLKKHGSIRRGTLGVRVQEITDAIAEGLGMDEPRGVLILDVTKGSAAELAGIREGDIILKLNEQKVSSPRKLRILVSEVEPNTKLSLEIMRADKTKILQAKLTPIEDSQSSDATQPSLSTNGNLSLNGVTFSALSKENMKKYGVNSSQGIIITEVARNSPWRSGLRTGDVISAINQRPVKNTKEFKTAYDAVAKQSKKNIVFLVKRQNITLYIALPLLKQK